MGFDELMSETEFDEDMAMDAVCIEASKNVMEGELVRGSL